MESQSQDLEKLKAKKIPFRFKGNEEQVLFNNKTIESLENSIKFLDNNKADSVKPILEEALKEVKKRNKLTKLADKSEAGWLAVDEYLADDLARDSDDDKKIRKAQARAMAKKKKVHSKPRSKPYQRNKAVASPSNPAGSSTSSGLFRPIRYGYNTNFSRSYTTGPRPSDFCFACGKTGHWRRNCPATKSQKDGHAQSGQF